MTRAFRSVTAGDAGSIAAPHADSRRRHCRTAAVGPLTSTRASVNMPASTGTMRLPADPTTSTP